MKRLGMVLLAVTLGVAAARPAMAQKATGSLRYGISAGVLLPMGNYGDADKMGFVGGAGATYWLPALPIGIRGDLSYSQSSHDGIDGNTKIMGGMASVVYSLNPASAPARILLTGGLGYYNVKESVSAVSESKVAFGGGVAVAFKMGTGSTRLVVGTRYTSVSTSGSSTTFLPLTVGLTFGK
jgi:Outer membrane protein beta-barrel domain